MADAIHVGTLEAELRFKHNLERELQATVAAFEGLEEQFDHTEASLVQVERAFQSAGSEASAMSAETIAAANDVADAIAGIGGAASVSSTELAQVAGVVTAAVEEYRRLGTEAPANLAELSQATDALRSDYKAWADAAVDVAKQHDRLFVDLGRVNELTRQFAGADVIRSAEEYAAAIERIGGVSKLTAAEAQHANTVISQGIEKLRALGQDVPPQLEAIASATRSLSQDYGALSDQARRAAEAHGALFVDLQRVSELAQQFGGGDAIRTAEEYAAAVEKVGGVARLTAQEQEAVNRAIGEGLEKLRALGQEAPQHLKALHDATTKQKGTVDQLNESLGAFGLSLRGLTAAGVIAGLAKLAKDAAQMADSIENLRAATGLTVSEIQRLGFAGAQVGVGMREVANGVLQLQKQLIEARDAAGESGAAGRFRELGLSLDALIAQSPGEMFETIAEALSQIPNPAERTKAAFELLGPTAKTLLPLLNSNVKELESGIIEMSANAVAALDSLGDTWFKLKTNTVNIIGNMIGELLHFAQVSVTVAERQNDLQQGFVNAKAGFDLGTRAIEENRKALEKLNAETAKIDQKFAEDMVSAYRRWNQEIVLFQHQNVSDQIEKQREAAQRYREEIAELAKQFSGAKLAGDVKKLADAVRAAGGAAKLSAFEHEQLGERLEDIVVQGGRLPEELQEIFEAETDLSDIIPRVTVGLDAQALGLRNLWPEIQKAGDAAEGASTQFRKLVTSGLPAFLQATGAGIQQVDINEIFKNFDERRLDQVVQRLEDINAAFDAGAFLASTFGAVGSDALGRLSSSVASGIGAVGQLNRAIATMASDSASSLQKVAAGFESVGSMIALVGVFKDISDAINEASDAARRHQRIMLTLTKLAGEFEGSLGGMNVQMAFSLDLIEQIEQTRGELFRESDISGFGDLLSHGEARQIEAGLRRQHAVALNILSVVEELGGVTARNLDDILKNAAPLFGLIEQGGHHGAEAIRVLNGLLDEFAGSAEVSEGLWDQSFLSFIQNARDAGAEVESLNNLIRGQLDKAAAGLTGFLSTGATAFETLREKQEELADLQARAADAGGPERERLLKQIAEVTAEIDKQKSILQAVGITSQQSAEAFGSSIAGIFASLLESGVPIADVIAQVTPAVQSLEEQLAQTGLTGGAAFDAVRGFVALLSDDVSGPVLQAVLNLDDVLIGLQNTGLLNQDTFSGLAGQITDAFNALVSQGKDADQVMRIMKDPLQTLWELQKDFGFEVDESTQALLNQAEAAGIVGEKSRDPMTRMIDALDRMNTTLETIARGFGFLPRDAAEAAGGIERAFDDIKIDVPVRFKVDHPPDLPGGVRPPEFARGTGGFRDFGAGTLAVLHGREAVVPEGQTLMGGEGMVTAPIVVNVDGLPLLEVMAKTSMRYGAAQPLTYP